MGHWGRLAREFRKSRSGRIGLVLVLLLLAGAVLAGLLSPHDPYAQHEDHACAPPGGRFPLGTDDLGRDTLSRVLYGARTSLVIGLISMGVAIALGVPLGVTAGYVGGWTGTLIMRGVDILMALPSILLAIVVMVILGPGLANVMVAVGIVNMPRFARQLRAEVLRLKTADYVVASQAAGASTGRILVRTLLPNLLSPILILGTLGIGTAVLEAAGLCFLGLGGEPDLPEWGNMLTRTRELVRTLPWAVIAPGAAITMTVLGFNLLGDGLRDALDPRLSRAATGT